jgi:hypothetical protein
MGFSNVFMGPELAWGISSGVVRKTLKDWMNRDHK